MNEEIKARKKWIVYSIVFMVMALVLGYLIGHFLAGYYIDDTKKMLTAKEAEFQSLQGAFAKMIVEKQQLEFNEEECLEINEMWNAKAMDLLNLIASLREELSERTTRYSHSGGGGGGVS